MCVLCVRAKPGGVGAGRRARREVESSGDRGRRQPRFHGTTTPRIPPVRGGWNREEEAKGGSKQEREGRKLGAGGCEGGRAKSPGDTGRGGEEEGITARTERIPEREAAVAETSRAKS